jgi:hypothetical protein
MSKWLFVGVPCLTCLSFLGVGARPRPISDSGRVAADSFVFQTLGFDYAAASGRSVEGRELLEQTCAKLRDARWLRVTIWQRLHDADHPYESSATLTLGPDHCARMETTLHAGAASCQHLLVSDGRAVAEVERFGGAEKVTGGYLPGEQPGPARENYLRRHGCTGPLPLLVELQAVVPQWQVQAGAWRERAVIRLEGAIAPGRGGGRAAFCRVYLDAASRLPLRFEWFKHADPRRAPLHLEMEYRDLELDRALTPQECARAFTYEPEQFDHEFLERHQQDNRGNR